MSSTKGKVLRFLSGIALKRASVVEARDVGGFRRLLLKGDIPAFAAGTKVQLLLPSDDTRTYTPIASPEGVVLLGWKHAGGPGARWMSNVPVGEEVLFVGPQRSLELSPGPVVIVGDETSVAVAAAFEAERPGLVRAVLQCDSPDDVRAAAADVGLSRVDVVPRGDSTAAAKRVVDHLSTTPDATIGLTGSSDLIVSVRGHLREAGVRDVKTRTYWARGKTGLD